MIVHLNGSFVDQAAARIPVDDRGFVFADGVYEVIRVYDGNPFLAEPHLQRLRAGLAALRIDAHVDGLLAVADRLLDDNGLRRADATIYIQVTRGAAPRKHAFPSPPVPATVYVAAKPFAQHPPAVFDRGVAAIAVPDTRWSRCDIKSIALLPNVLANQQAHEAGAFEALFVRDGALIEGSHSNLFGVIDGELRTYPECNYILGGITRSLVIALARDEGIPVREAPIYWDRVGDVTELFLSGTTTEVMPVTTLDARPVADGQPGTFTRWLLSAYREFAAHAARVPVAG